MHPALHIVSCIIGCKAPARAGRSFSRHEYGGDKMKKRVHKERLTAIATVLPICAMLLWLLPHAQTSFEEIEDEAARAERENAAAAALLTAELEEDSAELNELALESVQPVDPYTYRNKELREVMLQAMEALETDEAARPAAEKLMEAGLLTEPGFEGEEAVSFQPFPPLPPEPLPAPMPNMVIHEPGYYSLGESGYIYAWDGEKLHYTDVLRCSCTAYTTERQINKITATGTVAHVGGVAVDPTVIRYGTDMYIVAEDGSWAYGYAHAEDCGGGIKGNKIDLFMDTYDECIQFGVRPAYIYILG